MFANGTLAGFASVAIQYMLRHWNVLTLLLRQPGTPLDNTLVERPLKKAILHSEPIKVKVSGNSIVRICRVKLRKEERLPCAGRCCHLHDDISSKCLAAITGSGFIGIKARGLDSDLPAGELRRATGDCTS